MADASRRSHTAGADHDAGAGYLDSRRAVLGQCHCCPVDLLEDGGPLGLGRRVPAMMRSCRPQSRPYCTRMISAPGPVARAAAALMLLTMCLQLRCISLRGTSWRPMSCRLAGASCRNPAADAVTMPCAQICRQDCQECLTPAIALVRLGRSIGGACRASSPPSSGPLGVNQLDDLSTCATGGAGAMATATGRLRAAYS